MNRTLGPMLLIGVLALALGAAGSFAVTALRQSVAGGAGFAPVAEPPQGRELLAAFSAPLTTSPGYDPSRRAADCRAFGTLCAALADVWVYDGSAKEPRLTRQSHLAELRQVAREYRLGGVSLAREYPQLAGVIEAALNPIIPSGEGAGQVEITPDVRAKWIESHRVLSRAAEWAAGNL